MMTLRSCTFGSRPSAPNRNRSSVEQCLRAAWVHHAFRWQGIDLRRCAPAETHQYTRDENGIAHHRS